MTLAPPPTSLTPEFVAQMVRSAEWCPWPLKCMATKLTITPQSRPCACMNCVLYNSVKWWRKLPMSVVA